MLATERADGRWPALLENGAHVEPKILNRKHQACPFCGGKDRFRFADKGKGLWVCSQCTKDKYVGGLEFIRRLFDMHDAKDAARWIHSYYDGDPNASAAPVRREFNNGPLTEEEKTKRVRKMQSLWDCSVPVTPGDPVDAYLRRRVTGLQHIPSGIRYLPELAYWERADNPSDRPIKVGVFPAMIIRGFDPMGNLVQIHKTYLTREGCKAPVSHPKKTDVGVGANSFALRIMDVTGDALGVSEGVETGLRAGLMHGVPVWPCHSSSVMSNFKIPSDMRNQIRKLYIFGDNDIIKTRPDGSRWNPGRDAARKLADQARAERIRTILVMPQKQGLDFANL